MIQPFSLFWFEAWLYDYNIEKAEKSCDILLRLGLDFIDRDINITKDCLNQIDNAAGDMLEPEILSKEIIFGAAIEKRKDESKEMSEFFNDILNIIKWNDIYSHEDGKYSYLIESIEYAKEIQDTYGINVQHFEKKYLFSIIDEIINSEIREFVEYLWQALYEEEEINNIDTSFSSELLDRIISAYEEFHPKIYKEILEEVKNKKDQKLLDMFNKLSP